MPDILPAKFIRFYFYSVAGEMSVPMSIFKPYKYKNKPDLLPDAPVKHGFFIFWEIFFRKFWRFISLNIFYFLVTLPILLWAYLVINGYFALYVFPEGEIIDILPGIGFFAVLITYLPNFVYIPILALSILLYGPATMGITYIFRNFAREEHAWLTDFVSRALSNFKQGVFFGLLDILVVILLISGMLGGVSAGTGTIAILSVILRTLCLVVLVVYAFMRHYFYLMAVTVELSVFRIIKNAVLFVVIGFGRNLFASLTSIALAILCFLTVPMLTFLSVPLIFYSFTGFATVFICYPIIKKYIVVPALEIENNNSIPSSTKQA